MEPVEVTLKNGRKVKVLKSTAEKLEKAGLVEKVKELVTIKPKVKEQKSTPQTKERKAAPQTKGKANISKKSVNGD